MKTSFFSKKSTREELKGGGEKVGGLFHIMSTLCDTHFHSLVLKTLMYNHRCSCPENFGRFRYSSRDCNDNDPRLQIDK